MMRCCRLSQRGHTALDTRRAVALLKERGYAIGLQMMMGLPGQDVSSAMTTALDIAGLYPDFVRIYPTLVLKNSRLEKWYQSGVYEPLSLDAAVTQVKKLYGFFREKQIPVIRMGLQASESLDFDRNRYCRSLSSCLWPSGPLGNLFRQSQPQN